jgi:hypothetical protein
MLAGMVLVSAVVGMVAVAATLVLSLPTWMTLLAYPGVCSLTLLFTAALWSIRSDRAARDHRLVLGSQADRSLG